MNLLPPCENRGMSDTISADLRYSRQIALPGFGHDAQAKLAGARVLVIGAGGLGSSVLPSLAAAGVGTAGIGAIGIVDDDRVETSNLHRQLIHTPADVGAAKVTSAAESIAALNPATRVEVIDQRLSSDTALELFALYDLVLDGSDNFPTRYLAADSATLTGIPLVWGAVSQYSGQVGVSWADRGPQYRDLFPTPPAPGSVLSCEAGGVLPTVVSVIGSLMAGEAIKIITGVGEPLIGRVTTFDSLSGGFRELGYQKDPDGETVTELIDYDLFCGVGPQESGLVAAELAAELATDDNDIDLVDIREPWEIELASIPGSRAATVDELLADPPVGAVLYCHHGVRSAAALQRLAEQGIAARHLEGGIDAWSREVDAEIARY